MQANGAAANGRGRLACVPLLLSGRARTLISACRLTILKLYKILAILEMQVLRIKVKFFKIKSLRFKGSRIKARKNAGATAVLADISGDAPVLRKAGGNIPGDLRLA